MDKTQLMRTLVFAGFFLIFTFCTFPSFWVAVIAFREKRVYLLPVSFIIYLPIPALIFSTSSDMKSFLSPFPLIVAGLVIFYTLVYVCLKLKKEKLAQIFFIPILVLMIGMILIASRASITI